MKVVCPRCSQVGWLYYNKYRNGFYVHHERTMHRISDGPLEVVPYSGGRLNLVYYAGGDSFLLPHLMKMIPPHVCYVEVFGGGAPLLLNKSPSKVEVYNDIDGDLVNLFRVVKERFGEFIEELRWVLYSRELYYDYLYRLEGEGDSVKRAAMYFYVLRASYGGKFGKGFSGSKAQNDAKAFFNALQDLEKIHKRLRNVVIERLDFRSCIRKYDGEHTFFYMDPPHLFITAEKNKDYYRGGPDTFNDKDYMELLSLLENIKGKWLLKQTETPFITDWAREKGYRIVRLPQPRFTSIVRSTERPKTSILLIRNY